MSAPARDTPVTTSASGLADGFGRRLLAFAREDGVAVERLYLRPQFTVYERPLRDVFARLTGCAGGRIVGPQTIERDALNGQLVATSPFVSGERLGDLLESAADRARNGETVSGIDVAIGFLLDLLPALADLRAATGLPHGAIAPTRCVFTPDGAIVLTECGFATVLQRMNASSDRLWREFGVAVPPGAGAARFDETGDISQAALLSLMLMVGRPLTASDPVDVLPEWLAEAVEIAQIRGSVTFSVNLQRFLQRALPLPGRRPYLTIEAALQDVQPLANAIGEETCRAALAEFVRAASGTVAAAASAWATVVEAVRLEPISLEPVALEPVGLEPVALEPVALEPIAIDPPAFEPAATAGAGFDEAVQAPIESAPAMAALSLDSPVAHAILPEPVADVLLVESATTEARAAEPVGTEEIAPVQPVKAACVETAAVEPRQRQPEPEPASAPAPAPVPVRRNRWRSRRTDKLRSALAVTPPPNPEPAHEPVPVPAPAPVATPVFEPPPPVPFIERPAAALVPLAPAAAPKPVVVPSPVAPALYEVPEVVLPMAVSSAPPQPVFTPLAAPAAEALWMPPAATTPTPAATIVPKPQPLTVVTLAPPAQLKLKTDPVPSLTSRAPRYEPPRDPYPGHIERRPDPAPASRGLGRLLKIAAAAGIVIGAVLLAGRVWQSDAPRVIAEVPRTEPVTVAAPSPVKTGTLIVQTQPAGARVLLDGSAVGETPLRIVDVAPGRHALTLITPTATVRRTVKVEANKEMTVDVPVFSGWVAIFAPIVLEVSEDGRALGSTDQGRLLLPPGRHTLTLTNAEYGYSADHAVEIEAGEVRSLNLEPTGTVSLNAVPWAEIWIDGKRAGETPLANLKLPLGNREIVFKHPEFGERKMMTRVTGGEPVAVSVDFSR
jgi:hypothetical protein